MREAQRIADQLRRSHHGSAWPGPALAELLKDVDAARAERRIVPGAHNIWELALHITAWQAAALCAMSGGTMPELAGQQDWPATGHADPEWRDTVERLQRVNEELVNSLAGFPDERLGDKVLGRDYSFYFLLHGIAQHNLYHAGQIALLKAAARV